LSVNGRLETIEGKIEAFARRVDDEAEARHVLGERVSKLEKTL
jgi:DNA-binding FrmR family transcriptional regulator